MSSASVAWQNDEEEAESDDGTKHNLSLAVCWYPSVQFNGN